MTAVTTIIGNITSDPELRYSQNGIAIASFTVASTDKVFDKAKNEWVDGKKLFMRCTAWREFAEHIAGSLTKGMRVIAVGKIATDEYEDKDGNKRSSINMTVDSVGPDLKYATASVTRAQSQGGAGRGSAAPTSEPWAPSTPATSEGAQDVWNGQGANGFDQDVPF